MKRDWRTRLRQLIDETPGLTMKGLSLQAGLSETAVRDALERDRTPSVENFVKIARALGITVEQLLEGDKGAVLEIPVVGIVEGGEGWTEVSQGAGGTVSFEIGEYDAIGLEVRGESMSPVYRNGDFLICYRRAARNAHNLIGHDCVVRTADGRNLVKILKKGARPQTYTLKSYNPLHEDIENVSLEWVAPIAWIRRASQI